MRAIAGRPFHSERTSAREILATLAIVSAAITLVLAHAGFELAGWHRRRRRALSRAGPPRDGAGGRREQREFVAGRQRRTGTNMPRRAPPRGAGAE